MSYLLIMTLRSLGTVERKKIGRTAVSFRSGGSGREGGVVSAINFSLMFDLVDDKKGPALTQTNATYCVPYRAANGPKDSARPGVSPGPKFSGRPDIATP